MDRLPPDWNLGAPSGSQRTKATLEQKGRGAQVGTRRFLRLHLKGVEPSQYRLIFPGKEILLTPAYPRVEQRGRPWGRAGRVPEAPVCLCGGDRVPQVLAAAGSLERRPSFRSQSCPSSCCLPRQARPSALSSSVTAGTRTQGHLGVCCRPQGAGVALPPPAPSSVPASRPAGGAPSMRGPGGGSLGAPREVGWAPFRSPRVPA